jgi:hypothetical protein
MPIAQPTLFALAITGEQFGREGERFRCYMMLHGATEEGDARLSDVGRTPYLAKERVRRPITPSHHDPRLTNPIAAENLDPSGVVPNCCLKNGRGLP